MQQTKSFVRATLLAVLVVGSGCGGSRAVVVGPLPGPAARADVFLGGTRLEGPTRIDFEWQLNEQGSRVGGHGVARIEPPYRVRLDLFHNLETVIAAALVDDDLRLPPGAPDDVLPPVELMWATIGVFRPISGTELIGGDRLEDSAERLRYRMRTGDELHFQLFGDALQRAERLESETVVEWVRLEADEDSRYPIEATYRNLIDYRELTIRRTGVSPASSFDPEIWELGR